jgi:4-diphosphocytidyl-2-C-methyl-D-erythritol kinase
MRLTLRASAKINLDLRVLGRRPDGYHDVRTILQTLALHDTLVVESSREAFVLEGDAAEMPLDRTNLVWRAAEALWRAGGRRGLPRGARVRVVKRIPSRAGLGGGSSDAAAALVALNRVWGIDASPGDLAPVAAALGADVPFFLMGGTALGVGRGEHLYPLEDLSPRYVVLALPGFGVSTADAYRWLAADRRASGASRAGRAAVWAGWPEVLSRGRNDLEAPVERRHAAIRRIRGRLGRAGAETARMSGSGSAVFGLFRAEGPARRAAAGLAVAGARVILTRTRTRSPAERRGLA